MNLYDGAKKTLKDIVEKEAEKEQQQEEDIDLTPLEHERVLKGAYRGFVIPFLLFYKENCFCFSFFSK